jgi:hypothetical protein
MPLRHVSVSAPPPRSVAAGERGRWREGALAGGRDAHLLDGDGVHGEHLLAQHRHVDGQHALGQALALGHLLLEGLEVL